MGATGICWDNAAAESFFATLKRELVNWHAWATRAQAKQAIVRWIEGWYNPRRLHSSIDYLTPNEKESTLLTGKSRNDLSVEAGQLRSSLGDATRVRAAHTNTPRQVIEGSPSSRVLVVGWL
jgi:hypothetical protein